jgi:hypothetical protein
MPGAQAVFFEPSGGLGPFYGAGFGATASLERNSSRRWLIPYFGAALGGLAHEQLRARLSGG